MEVSVFIVNYNTGDITEKAVLSILKQMDVQFELIVVDNASTDDSVERLSQYKDKITLVANKDNVGFGAANNQAAKLAKGKYFCLLNPDAEFESTHGLKTLIEFAKHNRHYGVIGARILSYDDQDETPKKMIYPGERHVKHRFDHLPGDIAWVFGAIMLFHHDVYEKINGFDEDYFVYGEDADICLRARKAGYEIGHCADVIVRHLGSVTIINKYYYRVKLRKENGLYIFYRKHYTPDQVKLLIRKKHQKAAWRVFILGIRKLFRTLNKENQTKYLRYKAMRDLSKYYLSYVLKQDEQYCVFRSDYKFEV